MNLTKINLLIKIFLLICLTLILPTETVYATDIPIFVDNVPAYTEVSPFYQNNTLLVPVRLISEELGATVDWQNEQISINSGDCQIVLYVGQNQADVNGTSQNLSAPPQIVQGRLFVPLRFIGEALRADVLYRNGKIFLYSGEYKEYLDKANKMQRNNLSYTLNGNGTISVADLDKQTDYLLPTDRFVTKLLAVSRSGLVYASYCYVYYYSYNDNTNKAYFDKFPDVNSPDFTDTGQFFYKSYSDIKGYSYSAIFCCDVDGTNKKEIFIEREHYGIGNFQIYGGWLYYQERVPVEQEWGYDTYAGAINRLHLDGTNWQQLTEERVGYDWYVDVNGLHFDYPFKDESNVLSFNEMN